MSADSGAGRFDWATYWEPGLFKCDKIIGNQEIGKVFI
jgi:hypothetical protein